MIRHTIRALLLGTFAIPAAHAADPAAGEHIFRAQCAICHAVAPGRNGIGPTLHGVVGRQAGSVPGFHYSADHRRLGIAWDAAALDRYLANPRAMVPDTTMSYPGLKDGAKRADLIAYLATLK